MPDRDAKEIVEFVKKQEALTKPLRDRFERHHGLWRGDYFTMDGKKEEYQTMTTNRPRTFSDKIISELAFAPIKLNIPLFGKESKEMRANIGMTEHAVYGLRNLADENLRNWLLPPIQNQTAWDIANRGWVVRRVWLFEEDDKLIVDVACWDIRNTYWAFGKKGLGEVFYKRYAPKEEVDDRYGINAQEDTQGRVCVYDYWNEEKEKVVIEEKVVGGQKNTRGYLPIFILPVGSTRLIQSSVFNDTIKDQGQSCFARAEKIFEIESKVLSYYLSSAELGTHPILKLTYKGPENKPEVYQSPWLKGTNVEVDLDKGQDVAPMFQPTLTRDMEILYRQVLALDEEGTAPPILHGRLDQALTAQGTAMLIHAAMGVLKDGQKAMEVADAWLADELIRQYKEGDFADVELQGVDGKQKQFNVKVIKDNLVTERRFTARLLLDTPVDELQNVAIASQMVKDKIISLQTARDKYANVSDPDAEQEIIDREDAEDLVEVKAWKMLKAAIDEGDTLTAWLIYNKIKQAAAPPGAMVEPGGGIARPLPGIGVPPKGITPKTQLPSMEEMGLRKIVRGK